MALGAVATPSSLHSYGFASNAIDENRNCVFGVDLVPTLQQRSIPGGD